MRRLIKAIGGKISAASNAADIVKLRLVRVAVNAITATRQLADDVNLRNYFMKLKPAGDGLDVTRRAFSCVRSVIKR